MWKFLVPIICIVAVDISLWNVCISDSKPVVVAHTLSYCYYYYYYKYMFWSQSSCLGFCSDSCDFNNNIKVFLQLNIALKCFTK